MSGLRVPYLTMSEPKDFSRKPRVVRFTIDDDTFMGKPHLPAQTMIDFSMKVESLSEDDTSSEAAFGTMMGSLKMVLMPDSYKRFRERMNDPSPEGDDAVRAPDYIPIELDQIPEILDYLMGEYGMRPTKSSGGSSTGSPDPESGTNLTASTSDVALTSSTSPLTDS